MASSFSFGLNGWNTKSSGLFRGRSFLEQCTIYSWFSSVSLHYSQTLTRLSTCHSMGIRVSASTVRSLKAIRRRGAPSQPSDGEHTIEISTLPWNGTASSRRQSEYDIVHHAGFDAILHAG